MTSAKKITQCSSVRDNLLVKNIVGKPKKSQIKVIIIHQQFLSDVLNQSKMKCIREYLKQNSIKYSNKVFFSQQSYSTYEDYLLLNTLKDCQDKIYANNMYFQLTQIKIKNSKRTLKSYYSRLYRLMDDLQKTQIKSAKKKQRNKFKIKENIIKHLNLLIDAEVLQILQKYVDQHKEQLENSAQSDSQYIQKPFTLLEDCIILKTFKQRINQNGSYWLIVKCLSEKIKRKKNSIFSRLQNLFNCTKQKLVLCISNNLAIKIKLRYKTNSGSMIQNMKIITNQMIFFKNNDKMLDISQWNISEIDTFINKLNESRFNEDNESIIDILKELQFFVKKQKQQFMSQNSQNVYQSQSLFFDDQQQIQDAKKSYNNFYQSLCIEQKSSKKNRKNQKKKRKSKMTVVEQYNLTLTKSLIFQNNLQYIKQKWHLIPEKDEKTVCDESLLVMKQDE